MPIKILSWILWIKEDETKRLVDDLEYRWSITKRVSRDFLDEAECMNIQMIQDEIQKRLWEDKIKSLSIYDLESMLKWALERKQKLEWWEPLANYHENAWNKQYIDKLLNLTPKK